MRKTILFSIPHPDIMSQMLKYLFFKPNTKFGYMPADGENPYNSEYLSIWEDLCLDHDAKLVYIDNSNPLNASKIDECDTLMITGGNTFKLLHNLQKGEFVEKIKNFTNKENFVLAGFSAGAVILTPTIEIVQQNWAFGPDENLINLEDLSGIGVLDFEVLPHFNEELDAELLEEYRKGKAWEVKTIRDDELIVI
jgi:peptidase E